MSPWGEAVPTAGYAYGRLRQRQRQRQRQRLLLTTLLREISLNSSEDLVFDWVYRLDRMNFIMYDMAETLAPFEFELWALPTLLGRPD